MPLGENEATSSTLLNSLRSSPDDSVTWRRFLSRYQPLIAKWCRAWQLQDSDAADVTQEVLVRLARAMKEFEYDSKNSFRAWLKTVTRNAWIDWAKQTAKPGKGYGDTAVVRLLNTVEARDDLSKRLEAEYDIELMDMAILRVRMSVPPRTWNAFELSALEGLQGKEVAAQLKMQVAHVYVARSEVKTALQVEIRRLERCQENSFDVRD